MPHSTPISGFLDRIESLDDSDLIEVLYGDFVRLAFQGFRVSVTPGRPAPGADTAPQLVQVEGGDGRYGRARLYDDLVVISGPPGSLGEEHLGWLTSLREGVRERLVRLRAEQETDSLTGLGSETRFHVVAGELTRKDHWFGWLICLTMLPEEGRSPSLESVEEILRLAAEALRRECPEDAHLFRMDNGFFCGLVPHSTSGQIAELVNRLKASLAVVKAPGVAGLDSVAGFASHAGGRHMSLLFYQQMMEALGRSGGRQLTLSDLRRARSRTRREL